MPKQIAADQVPEQRRNTRYNFEEFADGEWYLWEQGKDKDYEGKSFPGTARAWAKRSGHKMESRTLESGKGVYLRFTKNGA